MTGFIIFIHIIACIVLVVSILMQAGRGGGLTEGFAPAESVFGTQTSAFLIRTTSIVASIFLVTSLSLTIISTRKSKSLMSERLDAPAGTLYQANMIEEGAEEADQGLTPAAVSDQPEAVLNAELNVQ